MAEEKRVFTALGYEDYEWAECTSAWFIRNSEKIETRKYGTRFNPKMDDVYDWVYAHKDIIRDIPFEEQEQMMIADGVLTPEDF